MKNKNVKYDFENALGWYRVSTKEMCEVRIENKELELLNFNPCGSSAFRDKDEKIYMIKTCEISSMKPCKNPKSENEQKLKQPKYKRGFRFSVVNISPIDIPSSHIMLYVPLYIVSYDCEVDCVNIGYFKENVYTVNIIKNGKSIGKGEMSETTIDKIIGSYIG